MKLIVCQKCVDVKLLTQTTQYCHCTKSGGNYNEDGDINAQDCLACLHLI